MLDIVKADSHLPAQPTSSDTADWYRLGDSVEKHGRHMKRQAVAAEYNQRPRGMAAWYREVGIDESIGRNLLNEARGLHMIGESVADGHSLSAALPSRTAAREYAKAEPEVREVIKEIIKEDPDAEVKAALIKRLQKDLEESRKNESTSMNLVNKVTEQLEAQTSKVREADDQKKRIARGIPARIKELLPLLDLYKDVLSDEGRQESLGLLYTAINTIK